MTTYNINEYESENFLRMCTAIHKIVSESDQPIEKELFWYKVSMELKGSFNAHDLNQLLRIMDYGD